MHKRRSKTTMGTSRNDVTEEQKHDEKPIQKRRKKSVHFPENYVQPIDDTSYENSSEEEDSKRRYVDARMSSSERSSEDLRIPGGKRKQEIMMKGSTGRSGDVKKKEK